MSIQDKHADFHKENIYLAQKDWKILGNYLVEAWSERTNKLYNDNANDNDKSNLFNPYNTIYNTVINAFAY
jgi:hypothetical protein